MTLPTHRVMRKAGCFTLRPAGAAHGDVGRLGPADTTEGPVQAWVNVLRAAEYHGFLARRAQKNRARSGVLVAPYRNPIFCAKMLTMLDFLSGGRLIVGVGAGWMRRPSRRFSTG